ncbi:MAG: class I SAM-dependent RNA methyltransferase [Verrucomicrobia bacterium]|nr:class I SAM-dependent RNA methyltransferase [Verrucomicrobiota bacterium]
MTEFSTVLKCEYFPLCSGCQRQGDISSPPVWEDVKSFFQRTAPDLSLALIVKEVTGWRTRSKLAVRGSSAHPEIGLFKQGSHQVVSIPTCPLHHPSINVICAKVKKILIERRIDPYDEERGTGILRYLQFVVERKTRRVQLGLIVNRQAKDSVLDGFVKQLYSEGGLHSVWLNFQPDRTNRIFGEQWEFCEGEPYLWERLGIADCAFHPACFGQAHLSLFEDVLRRIREWILPNASIIELYAGIGVIGLNLAPESKEIVCVEINPFASECFELSRLKLQVEQQKKISMQISSSEDAVRLISGRQAIIVDPPRKGLDPKVLEGLFKADLGAQLVYLSCGPISFQRDAEKLIAHGWKIEKAEGYLFFPGSDHVEILCCFKKVSG